MSDTATLDRVYMTLGGLKADSNSSSIDNKMRAGIAYAIERMEAALDRKSTRLNSSHIEESRMPSSA